MGATSLNAKARALVEALKSTRLKQPEPVPPEWLTTDQLSRILGYSSAVIKRRLHKLPIERKKFRIMARSRVMTVTHYRLK